MACSSCSSGRGGLPAGCKNNGSCGTSGCTKMPVFDWLEGLNLPSGAQQFPIVEIRFKNSRKEFFRTGELTSLATGDVVAVEATTGHDLGVVSMSGELVRLQLRRLNISEKEILRKVYRKAKAQDIERWQQAVDRENATMMRSRAIALELKLEMKISDVEFQGDGTRAIFYYTAEERVDFRELIRHLADEFKIRVDMRQIGSRQEAGRLGGIGSCGRELCCSTWLRDFRSVNTSAARYQQLAFNPQKLAGQCGKLKCCLNYELDSYVEAIRDFPSSGQKIETQKGTAFLQKTDIFRKLLYFAYSDDPGNIIAVPLNRFKQLLEMNKRGEKPEELNGKKETPAKPPKPDYENVVGQDSLTRFDHANKKRKKGKGRRPQPSGTQRPESKNNFRPGNVS